jgi:lysozyme family protein
MKFDQAFEKLIGHEGGYVNNPADPGGETKFGISKRSYPDTNMKDLTMDQAKAIYYKDFWCAAGCVQVPESIAFDLFDMTVNSGLERAVKTLQRAAGAAEDGVLGPMTLKAAASVPGSVLAARFNGVRLAFMASLPNWPTFSRGWALRIADNLMGI